MTRRAWILPLVLALRVMSLGSQWVERFDLDRVLADPEALSKLIIRYQPNRSEVLYVYGTGRVIKQAIDSQISDALVPTCTGRISNDEVQSLIRLMLDKRFFDLPIRTYWYATAADDEDDYWDKIKLHSIIIDDGTFRAQRDFAAGIWMDNQESIPKNFAAVEAKLLEIEKSATGDKPCRIAPGIRLPPAQHPGNAVEELRWSQSLTRPRI